MTGARAAVRSGVVAGIIFANFYLGIALLGGGWLSLGRIDPLLAVPGAGWAATAAVIGARAAPRAAILIGGTAAGVAILVAACIWAGPFWPWAALAIATGAIAAALLAARGLLDALRKLMPVKTRKRTLLTALLLCGFAIGWQLLAWQVVPRAYALPLDSATRVIMLSSLPLSPASDDIAARLQAEATEAPALALLRKHVSLRLIDEITPADLAETDVLLLAHPRALPPQSLVTIDDWVRGGGEAIVLADGLSSWPPFYPLGDPRNPPVTSLLTPLLTHWGLRLDAPSPADSGLHVWRQGRHRLHLLSAGRFVRENGGCSLSSGGIYGDCAIGAGRVLLLADADLLHGDLWYGTFSGRGAASFSSANALWLLENVGNLAGRERGGALAEPLWVEDEL